MRINPNHVIKISGSGENASYVDLSGGPYIYSRVPAEQLAEQIFATRGIPFVRLDNRHPVFVPVEQIVTMSFAPGRGHVSGGMGSVSFETERWESVRDEIISKTTCHWISFALVGGKHGGTKDELIHVRSDRISAVESVPAGRKKVFSALRIAGEKTYSVPSKIVVVSPLEEVERLIGETFRREDRDGIGNQPEVLPSGMIEVPE
jgi:hypothetical protein